MKKVNWKTTLGGIVFVLAYFAGLVNAVPDWSVQAAETVGIIFALFFAKDA